MKPGDKLFKVIEIFPKDYDIYPIEVLEVTLDVHGVKSFYYRSIRSSGLYHHHCRSDYYKDEWFFDDEDLANAFICSRSKELKRD